MRLGAVVFTAVYFFSAARAKIYGIAAPRTVAADSTVRLEIIAQNYIQSIQDVAIAFGIQPTKYAQPDTLGILLASKYLGPGKMCSRA